MGYKFNPFTGNLDTVDSPNGVFEAVEVNGDITLDDGGTYTTTLQTITPTVSNKTISLPDATGTVALVAGSSGQLVYNNAGAQAGAPGSVVGATGNITLSLNGAASVPPFAVTGTWFAGTTPQVLIQPSSVGTVGVWSASGTGLGVNAASGFTGHLFNFQINGSDKIYYRASDNTLIVNGSVQSLTCSGLSGGYSLSSGGADLARLRFPTASPDLVLERDAANTLAQRNSTNAQTFRVYGTFTDASNYERLSTTWSSNVCYTKPENAGTGSARLYVPVTGATTVSGLPAAATAGAGARAFVTDATLTVFLSTVVGGGANKVPVVSDGTNWLIG